MVEIRVFGKLRQYLKETETAHGGILKRSVDPEETMEAFLARIGIPPDAIYTIFLNSKLLVSRSKMAYWMRYPQVRENPLDWKLDVVVKAGDRIGLLHILEAHPEDLCLKSASRRMRTSLFCD